MFFIDSCVLIGAKRKRDKWHNVAKPMVEFLASGRMGVGYMLDYVLVEVASFLLRKDGADVAIDSISDLLKSRYLRLIVVDEIGLLESFEIMKKFRGLSLTDATIAYYMKLKNIRYLLSFDARFDGIPWITRIKNLGELMDIAKTSTP